MSKKKSVTAVVSSERVRLTAYAYGVMPLYDGEPYEYDWLNRVEIIRHPYAFLHYWVDEKLQYHEEEKKTSETPEIGWVQSRYKVTLNGPHDYKIESA